MALLETSTYKLDLEDYRRQELELPAPSPVSKNQRRAKTLQV